MNIGKHRTFTYICSILLALTLCVSCGNKDDAKIPARTFLDSAKALVITDADSALRYINRISKYGNIDKDTIHWARVLVYSKTYDMDAMDGELKAIIDSSDIDHKSRLYLDAIGRMVELCIFQNRLEDAIRYNLSGDSIAYAMGDNKMRAEFHYYMGMCVLQRDNELGEKYLKESIGMFNSLENDTTAWKIVIHAKSYLCNCYVMSGRYKEAIKVGEDIQHEIDSLSAVMDFNKYDNGNTIRANLCGLLCIAYAGDGRMVDAGMSYAECQRFNSASPSVPLLLANCLLAMERVEEATEKLEEIHQQYYERGDSLTYEYADVVNSLKRCYQKRGMMDKAFYYSEKEIDVREKLFTSELKNSVTEWEIRYMMREKETRLRDTFKDTRISRLTSMLLVGLLAVALVFIFMFLRYNRVLNAKNKALALQINRDLNDKAADKAKAEAKKKPDSESVPDAAVEQVLKFVEEMLSRKLFCDSNFDRETLMTECNLNRRLVVRYFETVMGKSYSKFLAVTRVEYAADQIRKYPNYTIEAIAAECGIASRATFYRLFSDHFGISPTDYRRQCISIDDENNNDDE
ncbi:MAG: AraC family transcriptional regulator [Bacteroidaceae bacterium]|nr:AraC family transcriptional regulator [Bacteroidaceae bacterium]